MPRSPGRVVSVCLRSLLWLRLQHVVRDPLPLRFDTLGNELRILVQHIQVDRCADQDALRTATIFGAHSYSASPPLPTSRSPQKDIPNSTTSQLTSSRRSNARFTLSPAPHTHPPPQSPPPQSSTNPDPNAQLLTRLTQQLDHILALNSALAQLVLAGSPPPQAHQLLISPPTLSAPSHPPRPPLPHRSTFLAVVAIARAAATPPRITATARLLPEASTTARCGAKHAPAPSLPPLFTPTLPSHRTTVAFSVPRVPVAHEAYAS